MSPPPRQAPSAPAADTTQETGGTPRALFDVADPETLLAELATRSAALRFANLQPLRPSLFAGRPGTQASDHHARAIVPRAAGAAAGAGASDAVPVWYWDDSVEALRDCASDVLRRFVYPLVAAGGPFCMAFPFPAAALARQSLTIDERERLDLEDIGLLLGEWTPCTVNVGPAPTPVERSLSAADPYAELDQSQRAAVLHGTGAARVLAPAGSGKTRTMIERVMELIRRGVAPEHVLALAFNRKAAEQFEERLAALGVPATRDLGPGQRGVHCATFNAFGYRYQRHIMGLPTPQTCDQAAQLRLLAEALRSCPSALPALQLTRGNAPLHQLLHALNRVRADLQPRDHIRVAFESVQSAATMEVEFGPIDRAVQQRQLAAGMQSFDDQIYIALADMLGDPARRELMQRRFTHVLVDEFQDLNGAQLALVDLLSRPRRNLFVVGDDDQLIYGWRFAKPANILDFHHRVPDAPHSATYTLSTNYRCSQAIVAAAQRLVLHNTLRVPKDVACGPAAGLGLVLLYADHRWPQRAQALCDFLLTEHRRLGCRWGELAVLCRYRAQQAPLAAALDQAGLPRTPLLAYQLFTHRAATVLRAYLGLIADPPAIDGDSLRRVLRQPPRFVRGADLARVCAGAHPWAALESWVRSGERPQAPTDIADFVAAVHRLHRAAGGGHLAPDQLLPAVVAQFGLNEYWARQRHAAPGDTREETAPQAVVEALWSMCLGARTLAELLETWDRHAAAEHDKSDGSPDALARDGDADRVEIGTIHAAKGREYASVVVADYDSDLDGLSGAEIEEERRVLYVAVTRAQEAVLLTTRCRHGSRPAKGRRHPSDAEPHPFLRELFTPPRPAQARHRRHELRRLRRQRHVMAGTGADQEAAVWRTQCAALESRLTEYRLFGLTWRRRLAGLAARLGR